MALVCVVYVYGVSLFSNVNNWYDLCCREHAMLVKIAGVRHLVVLINKMDDPTVKWSEERCVRVCRCRCMCVHTSHAYQDMKCNVSTLWVVIAPMHTIL